MPPATNEEQFKFLISCIRYSNNGKIDFGQVAEECEIVSRGAAAKRYERMMKAHGIATNGNTSKSGPSAESKKDKKDKKSTPSKSKKRKFDESSDEQSAMDDEEVLMNIKSEERQKIKQEGAQDALIKATNNSINADLDEDHLDSHVRSSTPDESPYGANPYGMAEYKKYGAGTDAQGGRDYE